MNRSELSPADETVDKRHNAKMEQNRKTEDTTSVFVACPFSTSIRLGVWATLGEDF